MAHMIDSMMYVGDKPWHGLGIALENPPSVEEALVASGLGWEVEKLPTYFHIKENDEYGVSNYIPTNYFVTIRKDTGQVLGNVGKKYEILQNKDAFKPFDVIIDWGFEIETAGSIDDGKKVWVLAKSPDTFKVGDDKILDYILLYTSHDGSSGNCFRDVKVRVVCNNTLNIALKGFKTLEYKLRHTASINSRINELVDKLDERKGNVREAIDSMNRFNDMPMNDDLLDVYFESVMPFLKNRDNKSAPEIGYYTRNKAKPIYDKLNMLYHTGSGNKGETLWDAYNSITEYYDHHYNHRGDWVKSTQFGSAHNTKVRAFSIAEKMSERYIKSTYVGKIKSIIGKS